MASLPAHNPRTPFLAYLSAGFHPGSSIKIRGFMPHHSDRFTIDLQCGPQKHYDDVALHLSVRPSECTIVRNTYQCRAWMAEERFGSSPISRGQPFDIDIYVDSGRYSIRINGQHYCEFNHRIPMTRVSYVHIEGDTTLQYVGLEGADYGGQCLPPPYYGGFHHGGHHHNEHHYGGHHHGGHHHGGHHHGGHHHGGHHHGGHHHGGHHHRRHHHRGCTLS